MRRSWMSCGLSIEGTSDELLRTFTVEKIIDAAFKSSDVAAADLFWMFRGIEKPNQRHSMKKVPRFFIG